MAGTRAGGLLAAKKIKENYGRDYYVKLGELGGRACVPKGFSVRRDVARTVGAIGGRRSRRPKRK